VALTGMIMLPQLMQRLTKDKSRVSKAELSNVGAVFASLMALFLPTKVENGNFYLISVHKNKSLKLKLSYPSLWIRPMSVGKTTGIKAIDLLISVQPKSVFLISSVSSIKKIMEISVLKIKRWFVNRELAFPKSKSMATTELKEILKSLTWPLRMLI
jgi:hypothetical protein